MLVIQSFRLEARQVGIKERVMKGFYILFSIRTYGTTRHRSLVDMSGEDVDYQEYVKVGGC